MKANVRTRSVFLGVLLSSSIFFAADGSGEQAASRMDGVEPAFDPALIQAMEYRSIGPSRGGRSPAVAGVRGNLFTFYMGTSGGGVWKTTDAGETWANISDGYFNCSSIGSIAVANSDPNVVYVGTGEPNLRGDVQTGIGVYKSEDAGKTWKHIGLEDTRHIGRIRIHPQEPDLVYVAALGHAFGPNEERGVYRSKDGGDTWEKVLYVSDQSGAVDLAMDVNNPRNLYAGFWQVIRKPWILISGGEESGFLYKSTDGGDTWSELKDGLPKGIKGRIGVDVSPVNSERVYVKIEAKDGGVYRSDDGGKTFVQVNKEYKVRDRPFYYTHIFADPVDADTVYVLTRNFNKSVDGGKTYEVIRLPHGDAHDLWINPDHPNIWVNGNDGGATISLNGGKTWSTQMNQTTAEFYRVATDNQFPYRVYGCQQDNSSMSVSSTEPDRRSLPDMYSVGGGEQGHVAVDPRDSNIVYATEHTGVITRYDHRSGQTRELRTYPELPEGLAADELKYRFQMNAPVRVSPHDPNVLFHVSQHVHRSTNEGQSWEVISPDLTRNDKSKQKKTGGPITLDHTGPEMYGTIFAFEESPHTPGLLWAGSDDGLVHVSRDGGANWENITPEGMPEWGTVNAIEPSPHDPGRVFLAVHKYREDDFTPYIFRTNDYGKNWSLITVDNGIPSNHFVRVVREDPDRKGLLYAGTEFGMYISFDDGNTWQPFQLNLPVVQIADMMIKEQDLVVATHGRSFWILDDLTPLHQITEEVEKSTAFLFTPKDAYRVEGRGMEGARVFYYLASEPEGEVKLEFLDSNDNVIQTFSSEEETAVTATAGTNRFVWDLRYPGADLVPDTSFFDGNEGPRAVPGTYKVRITTGQWTQTESFEIRKDPRLPTTQEDFQKQFDLAIEIRDKLTELNNAIRKIRYVRHQVRNLTSSLKEAGYGDEIAQASDELSEKLTSVEQQLIQTEYEKGADMMINVSPQLDSRFNYVSRVVLGAETRPTDGSYESFEDLEAKLAELLDQLQEILDEDVVALNEIVQEKNISPIIMPTKK